MKRTDKTQKPLYMTAAMVMMVLLAVTVLLAQDNTEAVILTDEQFQAVLAAGGSIPVGTILTDEQFERYAASINGGEDAEQGDAVEQDILANTQGDAETQFNIGRMYATGEGLLKGKDEAQAVRWYRRAADQDYAAAQYHLGLMYDNGRGVPENDAEAVKWYRLSADQGLAYAQYSLGRMYDRGDGVPENDAEAVKWYRLSADQGFAYAQSGLGIMYALGAGVPVDYVVAYAWINLAGAQGDEEASEIKDLLRTRMTRNQIARAQELSATLFDRIN